MKKLFLALVLLLICGSNVNALPYSYALHVYSALSSTPIENCAVTVTFPDNSQTELITDQYGEITFWGPEGIYGIYARTYYIDSWTGSALFDSNHLVTAIRVNPWKALFYWSTPNKFHLDAYASATRRSDGMIFDGSGTDWKTILIVSPDYYDITVSSSGYQSQTKTNVYLEHGTTVNFILSPTP